MLNVCFSLTSLDSDGALSFAQYLLVNYINANVRISVSLHYFR